MCLCMCRGVQVPVEARGIGYPGVSVIGGGELTDIGTGNQI